MIVAVADTHANNSNKQHKTNPSSIDPIDVVIYNFNYIPSFTK